MGKIRALSLWEKTSQGLKSLLNACSSKLVSSSLHLIDAKEVNHFLFYIFQQVYRSQAAAVQAQAQAQAQVAAQQQQQAQAGGNGTQSPQPTPNAQQQQGANASLALLQQQQLQLAQQQQLAGKLQNQQTWIRSGKRCTICFSEQSNMPDLTFLEFTTYYLYSAVGKEQTGYQVD